MKSEETPPTAQPTTESIEEETSNETNKVVESEIKAESIEINANTSETPILNEQPPSSPSPPIQETIITETTPPPSLYDQLVSSFQPRPPSNQDHSYIIDDANLKDLVNCGLDSEMSRKYESAESSEEKSLLMRKLLGYLSEKWRHLAELEPDEEFDNRLSRTETRECVSCRLVGDHSICGRLLPLDTNWIHANCLLCTEGVSIDDYVVQDLQNLFAKQKTVKFFLLTLTLRVFLT